MALLDTDPATALLPGENRGYQREGRSPRRYMLADRRVPCQVIDMSPTASP
jgi:hypothetical protein